MVGRTLETMFDGGVISEATDADRARLRSRVRARMGYDGTRGRVSTLDTECSGR